MNRDLALLLLVIYLVNLQNSFNEISKKSLLFLLTVIKEDNIASNSFSYNENKRKLNNTTMNNKFKFVSTLKQIKKSLPSISTDSEHKVNAAITPLANQSYITKLPVLLGHISITELLSGNISFNRPILEINSIINEVYLNDSTVIPDLPNSTQDASIFYKGYAKTSLQILEPSIINNNIIEASESTYVIYTPFEGYKEINLSSPSVFSNETLVENLSLQVYDYTVNCDYLLTNPTSYNDYIEVYGDCNLTICLLINANILQSQKLNIGKPEYIKNYIQNMKL